MQVSRSLFQTVFKDPNQPIVKGVSQSRPLFNTWAPSISVQRDQKRRLAMSSAASFYDFKPLDSKWTFSRSPLLYYLSSTLLCNNEML